MLESAVQGIGKGAKNTTTRFAGSSFHGVQIEFFQKITHSGFTVWQMRAGMV